MAFKIITSFALLAVCSAALIPATQDSQQASIYAAGHEEYAPAVYDFGYSVHDSRTGDIKSQQESRRGDVVQGQYSLVEPDGNRRIVDYSDDGQSGFNAHVRREGFTQSQQAALAAAPLALVQSKGAVALTSHAAPLALAHAAPLALSHQAPLAVAHQAPLGLVRQSQLALAHPAPLALAPQSPIALTHQSSLALAHQAPLALAQPAPFALTHQAPLALAHQAAPLAYAAHALAPQAAYAQNAAFAYSHPAPLVYAHQGHAATPYAIAQTAPIAHQAAFAAPLTHLASPYSLQNPALLAYHH